MNSSSLSATNGALPTCSNDLPSQAAASASVNSNDLFFMELGYDQQVINDPNTTVRQNGNISQMVWRVRGRDQQVYGYEYDYLDRLTQANYYDYNGSSLSTDNKYTTSVGYEDDRGNIASINRNSYLWDGSCWNVRQIDSLTFGYAASITNKLQDVTDNAPTAYRDKGFKYYDSSQSGADYDYDLNGNMIYDPSKSLTVEYNHMNLPTRMEFPDCKVIEFIYDAGGAKLSKVVSQDATLIKKKDYLGGIEYTNSKIEAIYHSEGRVYYEDGVGRYEYNLTDHLGNVRLSFTDRDGNGIVEATDDPETNEILSETHYYPFGMNMEGPWMQNAGRENPYLYNGKELNAVAERRSRQTCGKEFGLDWLSYGAREYDPSIGRFMTIDRFAEKYTSMTPYQYGANNPIKFIDVNGDSIFIPNEADRAKILEFINTTARGVFNIDDKGFLYNSTPKGNEVYSEYYKDKLIDGIKSDKTITIIIAESDPENTSKFKRKIDNMYGGGMTRATDIKDKVAKNTDLTVIISGNVNDGKYGNGALDAKGNVVETGPDMILAHELVGHAIPRITKSDTGNAIANTNKVRSQLTGKRRIRRKADKKHIE